MNVYSELLDLLRPRESPSAAVHFGTLSTIAPLCVTVGGQNIQQGLFYPRGMTFSKADIGRELALLPCTGGFLILCLVEGGSP